MLTYQGFIYLSKENEVKASYANKNIKNDNKPQREGPTNFQKHSIAGQESMPLTEPTLLGGRV
jgi:hypothetical protein